MRNIKRIVAAVMAVSLSMSFIACSKTKEESKPKKDLDSATREEIGSILAQDERLTGELENKTIKWLANWDINPDSTGKNVPIELAVFQERYGGKVESKIVPWESRYEQLSTSILGDEGIDFFPAGDMDAFPKGAIKDMFVSVDDHVDFSSELWSEVKDVNDKLMWKDKHYIMCTSLNGDNTAVIYNKKTIDEYGLDDPAELFAKGEWTWDAFKSMLKDYVDPEAGLYGIDGYWTEGALSMTTGVPYVGLKEGKLVNNLKDPNLERVQNYMADLHKMSAVIDKSLFNWNEQPQLLGEGKELFYPCGLWALYKTKADWGKTFGEDAFFVPMPKDPKADKHYIPANLEGYFMVKGGKNPEGVAKFAECKRITLANKRINEIATQQLVDDYGWSQEMIDMKFKMADMALENPVFDFYTGVTDDIKTILDSGEFGIRASLQGGLSWAETVGAAHDTVDQLIKDENDK